MILDGMKYFVSGYGVCSISRLVLFDIPDLVTAVSVVTEDPSSIRNRHITVFRFSLASFPVCRANIDESCG